jgi:ATP-dependent DNA helicase RecG
MSPTVQNVSSPAIVLRDVVARVVAARPALTLPLAAARALAEDPASWDDDLLRAVHRDLTRTLRGLVEDVGLDPDMLPVPSPEARRLDLEPTSSDHATHVTITAHDADDAFTAAAGAVPGLAWDGTARRWRVPLAHPAVNALRVLVREHRIEVSDPAAARLRTLAADLRDDPNLAAIAVVAVGEDLRPRIRFAIPDPALADEFKRIPSLRWDGALGAFLAPASRLREVLHVAGQHPDKVHIDRTARAAIATAEAPLDFDGTLDGLRGIPVTDLGSVGPGKKAERFGEFGIVNVLDLLLHVPLRRLDRANLTPIRSLTPGMEVAIVATVTRIQTDQSRRMVRFTVADSTGKIDVTYFQALWQAKRFRVGDEVTVYGKVDSWTGSGRTILSFTNPIMDPVGDLTLPIIPIYPQSAKAGVTTWDIQSAVAEALRRLGPIADPLPDDVRTSLDLIDRDTALRTIHLPATVDQAERARTRLAFDELFRMQAALLSMKAGEAAEPGIVHTPTGALTGPLHAGLPFPLTTAQTRVLAEIVADLTAPHPMHRLLQGEVGSGKTLVAITALLAAIEGGHQTALMAPTEILASQLAAELRERTAGLTAPDGSTLRVELFSNKLRGKARTAALDDLAAGRIHIAVGTHALLVDDVAFASLGLVVVDEQHRFGVEQRAALRAKGPQRDGARVRPDMLVMTATPIPRTTSLVAFGDLDYSVIDGLPPGRTPIVTSWIDAAPAYDDPAAAPWDLVRAQVAAGRQAYVVCPLVEDSEKMTAASATETFQALTVGALAGLRVGLIHGQLRADERAETMAAFRDGALDVLVATTVIEVGVNVPNASVIVVLDAGRFGIAQLHQLRGRVGRGQHASHAVLVGRCVTSDSRARMEALVASTDGFWLSEVDLGLRGHGQVFGAAQSGQSDLRVAELRKDANLLVAARECAEELLGFDPSMRRYPTLRAEISGLLPQGSIENLMKS